MNKREMLEHLATESGCSKATCEKMVSLIIKGISHGLITDGKVQLTGFGTFEVRSRKAHESRHPRTGESIYLNTSKTVGFRPGSKLKNDINNNHSNK